jgi:TRAP-type C4-dicarboxylate transport system permease small subunit
MYDRIQHIYKKILDTMELVEIVLSVVLLVLIVGIGAIEIYRRFILNSPMAWALELNIFFATWLYFLGFAITVKRGEDIVIDYFSKFFSSRLHIILNIIIPICTLLFCVIVLAKSFELQFIQSKMIPSSLPIRSNWYTLSVSICMASIILVTIYNLWITIDNLIKPIKKQNVANASGGS